MQQKWVAGLYGRGRRPLVPGLYAVRGSDRSRNIKEFGPSSARPTRWPRRSPRPPPASTSRLRSLRGTAELSSCVWSATPSPRTLICSRCVPPHLLPPATSDQRRAQPRSGSTSSRGTAAAAGNPPLPTPLPPLRMLVPAVTPRPRATERGHGAEARAR
jgi:hypothetical protein